MIPVLPFSSLFPIFFILRYTYDIITTVLLSYHHVSSLSFSGYCHHLQRSRNERLCILTSMRCRLRFIFLFSSLPGQLLSHPMPYLAPSRCSVLCQQLVRTIAADIWISDLPYLFIPKLSLLLAHVFFIQHAYSLAHL
jgi:hypothetical protein